MAHFIRNSQSPAYVPVTSKSPCRRAITDGFRAPSSRLKGHPSHIVLQANTLADRQGLYFDSQLPAMLAQLLKPLLQFGLCSLRTEFGEELHDDHPGWTASRSCMSQFCVLHSDDHTRKVAGWVTKYSAHGAYGDPRQGHNFLVVFLYLNRPTTPRQSDERSCSPRNKSRD